MEYYLQSDPSGRVFIDSHVHTNCVTERVLKANSWEKARGMVNSDEFVPCPGYGFFLDFFQNRTFCVNKE